MPVVIRTIQTNCAAAAVSIILAAPVAAQTRPGDVIPDPQLPAPESTIPEQIYPCNPGDYDPSSAMEDPDVPAAVDCGEVIVPSPGIDPDIHAPAPEPTPGTTPVIPPPVIEQR